MRLNKHIKYPTVDGMIKSNQNIVASDIKLIKEQLKNSKLTDEERNYLQRLFAFKVEAHKKVFRDPKDDKMIEALMEEGEKWHKRKDKNFDLSYDVMTD